MYLIIYIFCYHHTEFTQISWKKFLILTSSSINNKIKLGISEKEGQGQVTIHSDGHGHGPGRGQGQAQGQKEFIDTVEKH